MADPCPIQLFLLDNLPDDGILRGQSFCAKNGKDCCTVLLMGYLALRCDDPSELIDDLREVPLQWRMD